jgi:Glycosyl transferase family 21
MDNTTRHDPVAVTTQARHRGKGSTRQPYAYAAYSRLTGPLAEPDPTTPYRVQYRSLMAREPHRVRVALMLTGAILLTAAHLVWLLWPNHWSRLTQAEPWLVVANVCLLAAIGLLQLFNLTNVVSMVHATLGARDPIPVTPEPGTRVAFITTIVPGKEPVEMAMRTVQAARRIRHPGRLDVWLLDEGNDPTIRAQCARVGVHHFSRKGVPEWNQASGPHRTKTKHGNYNSWLAAHGDQYDFFISVDTDHVPHPNMAERMLGYFRDPNIAFVISPQVYGNYESSFVTKAAESQQFLFHSIIQRAGNRYRAPMFVGTNNAVRVSAIKAIGGFYDSITEDMATGLEFHSSRNRRTGQRWSSVYTPDVLAVGEGPSSWTDFFTQQMRWSRGAYETLLTHYGKVAPRLSLGRFFHYNLMILFYPMAAVHWLLGALSGPLYLGLGASALSVSAKVWLMLYGDAMAMQLALYCWSRRHNISPHEPQGSMGMAGMLIGALAGPIYTAAFLATLLRRPSTFVVTAKGNSMSPDRLATFRFHLLWSAVLAGSLTASAFTHHAYPAIRAWAAVVLLVSVLPVLIWGRTLIKLHRHTRRSHRPGYRIAQRLGGELAT